MNNQEVMNALSDIEEFFFYKKNNPMELSSCEADLKQMHADIKALLEKWHKITGLRIEY